MENKEFFAALADLVREKGISEEVFMETLKNALNSAYKKQYEGGAEVFVDIDPEKGKISFKVISKFESICFPLKKKETFQTTNKIRK